MSDETTKPAPVENHIAGEAQMVDADALAHSIAGIHAGDDLFKRMAVDVAKQCLSRGARIAELEAQLESAKESSRHFVSRHQLRTVNRHLRDANRGAERATATSIHLADKHIKDRARIAELESENAALVGALERLADPSPMFEVPECQTMEIAVIIRNEKDARIRFAAEAVERIDAEKEKENRNES